MKRSTFLRWIAAWTLAVTAVVTGTISGSTITGSTAVFGSGDAVTLDSSGITLAEGTTGAHQVKWDDGSELHSYIGSLYVLGNSEVNLRGGSVGRLMLQGHEFAPFNSGDTTLGLSSRRFSDLYCETGDFSSTIKAPSIGANTGTPLVLDGSGYIKTDSSSLRYKENIRAWQPRS